MQSSPAPSAAASSLSSRQWTLLGITAAAFLALFYRWIWQQHQFSSSSVEDWGHAYIVPLISIYLVKREWPRIASAARFAFWPGLCPMLLGIMCYLFFVVGVPNHMLQGVSLILTLAGVVLFTLGPLAFRPLFIPIAFLVFAVTISEQVMIKITFQLQVLAARGAELLLKAVGAIFDFLIERDGNTLTVFADGKVIPLNVAEACSGMRMVIAFVALAATVAVLSCRFWWQRIALLGLAVPVALLMNILRVAILGLASIHDPDLAAGDAHMLIGTLLLIPGLGLFLGVVWALNRLVEEPASAAAPVKKGGKPA